MDERIPLTMALLSLCAGGCATTSFDTIGTCRVTKDQSNFGSVVFRSHIGVNIKPAIDVQKLPAWSAKEYLDFELHGVRATPPGSEDGGD